MVEIVLIAVALMILGAWSTREKEDECECKQGKTTGKYTKAGREKYQKEKELAKQRSGK